MSDGTHIEWTNGGATWNIVNGCTLVGTPGCANCYAMRLAGTRLKHHPSRSGLTKMTKLGPVWNGDVRFYKPWLDQPIRWARPRMIFVCAHGDLFHERVKDEWLDQIFAVMAYASHHTYLVLTKRPERMRKYLEELYTGRFLNVAALIDEIVGDHGTEDAVSDSVEHCVTKFEDVLPHVWLGTSTENQETADERIRHLLATPAGIRWISAEPLLGSLDLARYLPRHRRPRGEPRVGSLENPETSLDWVVAGFESGPNARPGHPDWARRLRDDCVASGTAYFHKQNGAYVEDATHPERIFIYHDGSTDIPDGRVADPANDGECEIALVGKRAAGRLLDGREWNEFPAAVTGAA